MKTQRMTCLPAAALCCAMAMLLNTSAFAGDIRAGGAVQDIRELRFIKPAGKDTVIQVEVADTPEALAQGLMGRVRLEENKGMLFVFPEDILLTFWMKETLIPLDIIFVSKEHEIIDVISNAPPCKASPCSIYSSTAKGRYAIEVNAGFAGLNLIKVGDKVDF